MYNIPEAFVVELPPGPGVEPPSIISEGTINLHRKFRERT